GVRVPMREIRLTPTKSFKTSAIEQNAPLLVYDTSGPYTDPDATLDIRRGLQPLRLAWIMARGDVEELPGVTSEYGRLRLADPKLDALRFTHLGKPLGRKSGNTATRMPYAGRAISPPKWASSATAANRKSRAWFY